MQDELGDDGHVLGSIDASGDEPVWRSVAIEIHNVDSLPNAIGRIQPSVRVADPERNVVVGGSTSMQHFVPSPDWPRSA